MTPTQIAFRLFADDCRTRLRDPDVDARSGEIEEWETRVQLIVELERLVNAGLPAGAEFAAEFAAEVRRRGCFVALCRTQLWEVFDALARGDESSALRCITHRWVPALSVADETRLAE